MLSAMNSLMQSNNSQIARGFVTCFASELTPTQRRKLEAIKANSKTSSIKSNPTTKPPNPTSNPQLPLPEAIQSCYQRVLRSNSPSDRSELRSLICRLPSFKEIESVLRICVKKDDFTSQLEAKQFVLALLDASRLEEAEKLAQLLKNELNVCVNVLYLTVDYQSLSGKGIAVAQHHSLRFPFFSLLNKQPTLSSYTTPSNTATRTVDCTRSVPFDRNTPLE